MVDVIHIRAQVTEAAALPAAEQKSRVVTAVKACCVSRQRLLLSPDTTDEFRLCQ